jgi:hypothetical protein
MDAVKRTKCAVSGAEIYHGDTEEKGMEQRAEGKTT